MIEEQIAKLVEAINRLGDIVETAYGTNVKYTVTTSAPPITAFEDFVDQNVDKPEPVAPPEDLPQEKKRRKTKASKTIEPPEEEVTADHKEVPMVAEHKEELEVSEITVDKAKQLAKDKLAAGVLRQKIRDIVVDLQGDDASIATLTPENLGKFYSRVSDL